MDDDDSDICVTPRRKNGEDRRDQYLRQSGKTVPSYYGLGEKTRKSVQKLK